MEREEEWWTRAYFEGRLLARWMAGWVPVSPAHPHAPLHPSQCPRWLGYWEQIDGGQGWCSTLCPRQRCSHPQWDQSVKHSIQEEGACSRAEDNCHCWKQRWQGDQKSRFSRLFDSADLYRGGVMFFFQYVHRYFGRCRKLSEIAAMLNWINTERHKRKSARTVWRSRTLCFWINCLRYSCL